MNSLQIILIALIVFIFAVIALMLATNRGSKNSRKKLDIIRGKSTGATDSKGNEKDIQNKRRAEIAKKLKESKGESAPTSSKKITISMRLEQAGLSISGKQFWLFSVILMVASIGLCFALGFSTTITCLVGVIALFGIPRFILRHLIQKRQKKFLSEFADALEAMVRLLKAGMPVSEAVLMASREFTGPVGEEMSRVYDKQKIGVPLHEAALEACRRMPLTEMQMFATGLAIQAQTGSSLSEVLTNLAGVIRARFKLKRKIKALSSEAIASASIIGALPLVVSFGLWAVNPGYIETLFISPTGRLMLYGAGGWMCLGIFVMKQMINFKI